MPTPQQNYQDLADAVGVSSLYLKREDLHPYGSHKGRSIPVMIDHYFEQGKRYFAISSSGNAALAAALYVKEINGKATADTSLVGLRDEPSGRELGLGNRGIARRENVSAGALKKQGSQKIKLEILIGNKIPDKKLEKLLKLADEDISVNRFERPLQALTQKTVDGSIQSLRQSTDDIALIGYGSLAKELEKIKDLQAVFLATSSGTTAQALAEYFAEKKGSDGEKGKSKPVEIHIVQTTSCHPMSLEFVDSLPSEDASIADAIVDITAHRKSDLLPLVTKSGGSGWIATNTEIQTAQELIKKHAGFEVSPNGALSVAGLMQAIFSGKELNGAVACVIGGE